MKTIHQIYNDGEAAVTAVKRLEAAGVAKREITLLRWQVTNAAEKFALLGGLIGIVAGAALAFTVPALQPEGAALVLMPLAGGTLGLLSGAVVGASSDEHRSAPRTRRYEAALRLGGALVIARVSDDKANVVRSLLWQQGLTKKS